MRQATRLALWWVLFTSATAAAQPPAFRMSVGDMIFGGAESMVATDVDGDGLTDLVMPSGQQGVVVIFYGLGDGQFDFQRDFFTGNIPMAAAVADFDGDGLLDIATADSTSSAISVILGTGNREFSFDPIISIPSICSGSGEACETEFDCPEGQTCDDRGVGSPNGMAVADVNGDGMPDLAIVSGEAQGEVAVVFGIGAGGFAGAAPSPYITGAASRAVRIADLDGNGSLDLVTANRDDGTISVLLSAGSGIFSPAVNYPAGQAPVDLTLADFNGDGNLDVAVANRNSDSFSLLLGDGEGAFGTPNPFPAGLFPSAIASGDIDGDGHADVAVTNKLSYDVTIGFGDGQGGFFRRSFLAPTGPEGVAIVPLADGGTPDVVLLGKSGESDNFSVLLAESERRFRGVETVRTGANPAGIASGDFTGDGLPDLVVSSSSTTDMTFVRPLGGGSFDSLSVPAGGASFGVLLADLDFTGRPDLLFSVTSEGGDELGVAPADGKGGFGAVELYTVTDAAAAIEVGDLNEDGRLDVVLTQGENESLAVLLRTAEGGFEPPSEIFLRPLGEEDAFFPRDVTAADLDGDGHLDLSVAEYRDAGMLTILYGRGDGTFELPAVNRPSGRRPLGVRAADLDNDGILDILTANEDSSGLVIHRGLGGRDYAAPVLVSAGTTPAGMAMRDVNGDGILDVIVADRSVNDRNVIRPGGGQPPSFLAGVVQACPFSVCLEAGRTPVSVVGADFDDSGIYDLATVNDGGSNVSIALSTLEAEVLRGDANADGRVSAADLTAIWGRLPQHNRQAIEGLVRADSEAWNQGFDADGDGLVSSVDTTAVAARIFR